MSYTDPDYLGTVLQDWLDVAEAALTVPVTRVYVSHGPPAADCADQLTVHAQLLQASNPLTRAAPGPNQCAVVPVIAIVTTIFRCVPVPPPMPPAVADLNAAYKALLQDLWEIWRALVDAWLSGTFGDCSAVTFRDARPLGPSGAFAGWQITVEVALT